MISHFLLCPEGRHIKLPPSVRLFACLSERPHIRIICIQTAISFSLPLLCQWCHSYTTQEERTKDLVVLSVYTFRHFASLLVGWLQYSYLNLNRFESPLGYGVSFLNLSFDVLSVKCRVHNIWLTSFNISFHLIPLIDFSFNFTCGPYAAFHGMTRKCHIEGAMITAVRTYLRMFFKFIMSAFSCFNFAF
jgi:hypothetical protein